MEIKDLEIVSLDHQGRGIARNNGDIIFIPNTLIGEIVDVSIVKKHKQILEGIVLKYIKTSEERIEAKCPYYNICGGCDLMHMSYDKQLEYKQNKVKEIINKFCKTDILVKPIISNPSPLNYRNKTTFKVDKKLGFYKKQSNEFIAIDKCLLSDEKINNLIGQINSIDSSKVNEVVIRTSKQNNDTMLIFNCHIDTKNLKNINCDKIVSLDNITNKSNIIERLGSFDFLVSPNSFFQVNTEVAVKLYDKIKEYGDLSVSDTVLDLYCGTGSIGIYLSPYVKKVIGIEINKSAIDDAIQNKKINDIKNIDFICGDAAKKVDEVKTKIDLVVVDPPRAGLDKKTIDFIINKKIKKVIYVSCDPVTLARDLNILKESYNIIEITPVDMFSNTHHVECVCVLNRR